MSRILRMYVIREIALPTVLALLTITFILLIGIVYDFINLLLQPGISIWSVFHMLLLLLPSYITFALPMAILMGSLIGIGRMTLDREILAARASGVNLLSIFTPALLLALFISLGVMWAAGHLIPRWEGKGLAQAAELQFKLIQSLEPGEFHDKLGVGDDSDFVLYHRARDENSPDRDMLGVLLKMEEDYKPKARKQQQATVEAKAGAAAAAKPQSAPVAAQAAVTSGTSVTVEGKSVAAAPAKPRPSDQYLYGRSNQLTLITAERGKISAEFTESDSGVQQSVAVMLTLLNGSIQRHVPDPEAGDNIAIHFDKLEKRIFTSANIRKPYKTMTNQELNKALRDVEKTRAAAARGEIKSDRELRQAKKLKLTPKRELVERYAMSLAFFVFALLAVPLAIWIKPSGKSWGIMLAIGLMLIYYIFMKIGGTMVELDQPMGVLVAFSPNILFTLLGAGLWWHNLRT